ncbi:hypothetical protein T484DRAFT_1770559 [Baffinella frigidus]|nr:hypothetical protein T484DRAFT_1770559 [Cryptophyta sp. CCMP2293]
MGRGSDRMYTIFFSAVLLLGVLNFAVIATMSGPSKQEWYDASLPAERSAKRMPGVEKRWRELVGAAASIVPGALAVNGRGQGKCAGVRKKALQGQWQTQLAGRKGRGWQRVSGRDATARPGSLPRLSVEASLEEEVQEEEGV